jgi:hypothetical protein
MHLNGLVQAAHDAGFRDGDLTDAVNVAMAERHINDGGIGPWGIHPSWISEYPAWTREWLQDTANNARAAFELWTRHGWNLWQNSSGYQTFYAATGRARHAVRKFLDGIEALDGAGGIVQKEIREEMTSAQRNVVAATLAVAVVFAVYGIMRARSVTAAT